MNVLADLTKSIEFYYKQKDAIENNLNVEKEITTSENDIKSLDNSLKLINKSIIKLNTDLISTRKDEEEFKANITKIKEYESLQKAYEFYTLAVSRDGIPFELISQAVPVIEKEVNSILHQISDFTVSIQTDGKNVMTYIVYNNKTWPLEMCSGMEKFISSIAIRVALINISNLPKTTGFILDEGWGVLDSNNLAAVNPLLHYLKSQFDFILIISHLDAMRDSVEYLIEITKMDGVSHIEYK